ncbi:MAG: hypothetical protein WBN77_06740, partial [Desulfobacterales bacterium]
TNQSYFANVLCCMRQITCGLLSDAWPCMGPKAVEKRTHQMLYKFTPVPGVHQKRQPTQKAARLIFTFCLKMIFLDHD